MGWLVDYAPEETETEETTEPTEDTEPSQPEEPATEETTPEEPPATQDRTMNLLAKMRASHTMQKKVTFMSQINDNIMASEYVDNSM